LLRRPALTYSSAKTFEDRHLDAILESIDPLLTDPDRFKQRAGAEVLVGLLRGMAFGFAAPSVLNPIA
jgi:tetrahydromethanopterin S-methyltransferase subunit B